MPIPKIAICTKLSRFFLHIYKLHKFLGNRRLFPFYDIFFLILYNSTFYFLPFVNGSCGFHHRTVNERQTDFDAQAPKKNTLCCPQDVLCVALDLNQFRFPLENFQPWKFSRVRQVCFDLGCTNSAFPWRISSHGNSRESGRCVST